MKHGLSAMLTATFAATCAILVFLSGSAGSALAADNAPAASLKDEIAALKAQIAGINGKLPSQSHTMIDVEYHFSNLWFAGQARNWPLAAFYLNETKNRLDWAVRVVPVRTLASGQKFELEPMLQSIEDSSLAELKKAVDGKDSSAFQTAYRHTMAECYGCHVAAERPFLKPHIPEQPESRVIAMNPNAPAP